jgi:hypothetical protein
MADSLTTGSFASRLRDLVGAAEGMRPLLCDGNPLTCTVALVGANPGATVPFWPFWHDEHGMDRRGWIDAYRQLHGTFRRSRAAIERLVPQIAARVIELNAHAVRSDRLAGLSHSNRTTDVLAFVLEAVRPIVIVCAGRTATRVVRQVTIGWQPKIVEATHFIYWGEESERRLIIEINDLLRHAGHSS